MDLPTKLLLFLFLHLSTVSSNVSESELFPFSEASDTEIVKFEDTRQYVNVSLSKQFRFMQINYTRVFISGNGFIGFYIGGLQNFLTDFSCRQDSMHAPTIIPYLSLAVNSDGNFKSATGKLFYREDSSNLSLSKAARDVARAFPSKTGIRLSWMLVVTWYNLAPEPESSLKNSFQSILTTDGTSSFVIFYYNKIQWFDTGINAATGPAVGIKGGYDGTHYIPGSCKWLKNLDDMTNIDEPGKFVFQVDRKLFLPSASRSCQLAKEFPPTCVRINFIPYILSMSGKFPLYINGFSSFCLESNIKNVTCAYQNSQGEIEASGSGKWVPGHLAVFCQKPNLDSIGKFFVYVYVNLKNGGQICGNATLFVVQKPGLNVNLEFSNLNQQDTTSISATIELLEDEIKYSRLLGMPTRLRESTRTTYDVLNLFELHGNEWKTIEILNCSYIRHMHTLGQCEGKLDIKKTRNLLPNYSQTVLRAASYEIVYDLGLGNNVYIERISDSLNITLAFLRHQSANLGKRNVHDKWCREWYDYEDFSADDILLCPLFLNETELDWRFQMANMTSILVPLNLTVYLQAVPSPSGAGSMCVYDKNGNLTMKSPHGSRYHRHSPNNPKNYVEHYHHDIIPYMDCCLLSNKKDEYCVKYFFGKRAISYQSHNAYQFPTPFRATGTAQITTLGGSTYLLNAIGAFCLAKRGNSLKVQIFLETFPKHTEHLTQVVITTTKILYRNSGRNKVSELQVSADSNHGLIAWLDNEPLNFYVNEMLNTSGVYQNPIAIYEKGAYIFINSSNEILFSYNNSFSVKVMAKANNQSLDIVGSISKSIAEDTKGLIGLSRDQIGKSAEETTKSLQPWQETPTEYLLKFPMDVLSKSHFSYANFHTLPKTRLEVITKDNCKTNSNCIAEDQTLSTSYHIFSKLVAADRNQHSFQNNKPTDSKQNIPTVVIVLFAVAGFLLSLIGVLYFVYIKRKPVLVSDNIRLMDLLNLETRN